MQTNTYNAYLEKIESLVDPVEDWQTLSHEPMVSVLMITYNHQAFIKQALDGALMQQTLFPYEIVIGDDCSTDGTREILKEYQQRYPDKVRLRLARENLYSQKLKQSAGVRNACRGKYIALCEGDDYWTDPHKLQKQVEFLEAHPEYSFCFHNVFNLFEDGRKQPRNEPNRQTTSWTIKDFFYRNPVNTCSVLFRNNLIGELPQRFYTLPMGDWPFWILLSQYGDAAYIDEIMAVYRIHSGGVYSGRNPLEWVPGKLDAFDVIDRELAYRYHDAVSKGKIKYLQDAAPEYLVACSADKTANDAVNDYLKLWMRNTDSEPPSRRVLLGLLYSVRFFHAAEISDHTTMRRIGLKMLYYNPSLFRNIGVWSLLFKALVLCRLSVSKLTQQRAQ